MADQILTLKITEKSKVVKYAEGVNPETGEPYEVVEGASITYTGQDAVNRLTELGYTPEQIEKMKEMSANASN